MSRSESQNPTSRSLWTCIAQNPYFYRHVSLRCPTFYGHVSLRILTVTDMYRSKFLEKNTAEPKAVPTKRGAQRKELADIAAAASKKLQSEVAAKEAKAAEKRGDLMREAAVEFLRAGIR